MKDRHFLNIHVKRDGREQPQEEPETKERLNDAVPEATLIRMLAKEKRDLQLENLELKKRIIVLEQQNVTLQEYCTKFPEHGSIKDMRKVINSMSNLWGQIGQKIGPMKDLCKKTDELKEALMAFVEECEKR